MYFQLPSVPATNPQAWILTAGAVAMGAVKCFIWIRQDLWGSPNKESSNGKNGNVLITLVREQNELLKRLIDNQDEFSKAMIAMKTTIDSVSREYVDRIADRLNSERR